MNGNKEGEIRLIFPDLPDNLFMATKRSIGFIPPVGNISESGIAEFCSDCEYLTPSNTCEKVDLNTQAKNAERKHCDLFSAGS
jgi:hypothetical protein